MGGYAVVAGHAAGTPTCPAAMRQDAANIQAGICAVDHMACVGNCRRNKLTSLLHRNSQRTRLLASNRMMLRQSRTEARFQPQGRNSPLGSLRGSPWPQRKNLGHLPAFAIGPTAVEEIPKADCRTRKGNNAPGTFSGPCCCSREREPKLKPRWDVHLSGDDDQLGCAGESLSSVLGG